VREGAGFAIMVLFDPDQPGKETSVGGIRQLASLKGGNHGDGKTTNRGAPQYQEGGCRREAEADNCASAEAHADGVG